MELYFTDCFKDFTTFKERMLDEQLEYGGATSMPTGLMSDDFLKTVYNTLKTYYKNAYILFDNVTDFISSFSIRYFTKCLWLEQKWSAINKVYETSPTAIREYAKQVTNSVSNGLTGTADTPTIEGSTTFVDSYTNKQIKSETSGNYNGHMEMDVFTLGERLRRQLNQVQEEIIATFSDLFQWIIEE